MIAIALFAMILAFVAFVQAHQNRDLIDRLDKCLLRHTEDHNRPPPFTDQQLEECAEAARGKKYLDDTETQGDISQMDSSPPTAGPQ